MVGIEGGDDRNSPTRAGHEYLVKRRGMEWTDTPSSIQAGAVHFLSRRIFYQPCRPYAGDESADVTLGTLNINHTLLKRPKPVGERVAFYQRPRPSFAVPSATLRTSSANPVTLVLFHRRRFFDQPTPSSLPCLCILPPASCTAALTPYAKSVPLQSFWAAPDKVHT